MKTISQHTITLAKHSKRLLNDASFKSQIAKILDRITAGGREEKGWKVEGTSLETQNVRDGYVYIVHCSLICAPAKPRDSVIVEKEFGNIVKIVEQAGNTPKWIVSLVDGEPHAIKEDSDGNVTEQVPYAHLEIPKDWKKYFSHLYNLENQIGVIMSSIQAAMDSDFANRFHCALVGAPASGKTETARAFKTLLGDSAVLEYDATATTAAGAIKDLDSRDEMPRIMIVEEIEKADEASFRWLLGVLDTRGEIRKINFRQKIQKEAKMLGIVTVNNFKLFESLMSGALASRCGEPVWFNRPTEATLQRILEREVDKVQGDKRWIDPAIKYAMEVGMYDPRHVVAICLRGKDDLLNGSYQKKLHYIRACRAQE